MLREIVKGVEPSLRTGHLVLWWRERPRGSFSLRAECLTTVISYLEEHDDDAKACGVYGGVSLNRRSHGESFPDLLQLRFPGGGLSLIDEPEAALSAARQLALLVRLRDSLALDPDTQCSMATHAAIVLAFRGARISAIDRGAIRAVAYEDTDPYVIARRCSENPNAASERRRR